MSVVQREAQSTNKQQQTDRCDTDRQHKTDRQLIQTDRQIAKLGITTIVVKTFKPTAISILLYAILNLTD